METRTLIEPTAQVVTITKLKANDVYKRLVKNYGDTYELRIGVVTDVLNNGSDAALTALEFSTSYNGAEAEIKVFGGDKDLALFAATPDEVATYLGDVKSRVEDQLETKRKEMIKLQMVRTQVDRVVNQAIGSSPSLPELTTPETD
jgi:uncharacterized protein YbjQ (UPF0145 family)